MLLESLDGVGVGVFSLDRDWRVLHVNETGRRLLRNVDHPGGAEGTPDRAPAIIGRSVWEIDTALEKNDFGATIKRAAETRSATSIRAFSERSQSWFEMTTCPVSTGVAVYVRDVSEEEKLRSELDVSVDQLRRRADLLDSSRDAVYVRELDDTISYWNRSAERMFGWSASEVSGQSMRNLLSSNAAEFDIHTADLLRAGVWAGELEQLTRDGRAVLASTRWQLALHGTGEPSYILGVVTDVVDNNAQQAKRYRTQRMESLGTLAGGIAHDLNNVFTPILVTSQLLASDESDPDRREMLESIETSVKRGAKMIRQVLTFAKGEEVQRALLDVGSIVEQLEAFCRDTLPKSISVTTSVPSGLWPITGDITQVLQVLMNLVTNARDAMTDDGGDLSIVARNVERGEHHPEYGSAGHVLIEVRDSGSGMTPEVAARVFEPFFSTKDVGNGTGLGMSTSITIVRSHGGDMEVESTVGEGTLFRIRLPRAVVSIETAGSVVPPEVRVPPRGRGQRILVVDDEEDIRMALAKTLELHGYRTFEAGNGEEAIALLQQFGSEVDLVFTDMMMPVMGGAGIAAYLMTHHPSIAIIAATGWSASSEVERAVESGVTRILSKPFETPELLEAIEVSLRADKRVA